MFEVNKSIFGNRSLDQIPVPTSKTRIKGSKKEVHFYTPEELSHYFATGELIVIDDTAWTEVPNILASTKEGKTNDNANSES